MPVASATTGAHKDYLVLVTQHTAIESRGQIISADLLFNTARWTIIILI